VKRIGGLKEFETRICANIDCRRAFTIINWMRVGNSIVKSAGRKQRYCDKCSQSHNARTRNKRIVNEHKEVRKGEQ
jgi:hypothetical protein